MYSRAAVVIPFYRPQLTASEAYSLNRTLSVLQGHDIYALAPFSLSVYLERIRLPNGALIERKLFPDRFFSSPSAYSNLMKQKSFYEGFSEYEYILIVQLDALVFSDQLDMWCDLNFSYVGAPWVEVENDKIKYLGVGNGGFSLRRVSDCIKFLSVPQYLHNPLLAQYYQSRLNPYEVLMRWIHRYVLSWNIPILMPRVIEDIFWGILAPANDSTFKVPNPEHAASFAFECAPEALYELNKRQLPFGCHAWERYAPEFWRSVIQIHGIDVSPDKHVGSE